MSAYCKCYHCGAKDSIDIDGACDKCGYPDKVIAELKAEVEWLRDKRGTPAATWPAWSCPCGALHLSPHHGMTCGCCGRVFHAALAGKEDAQ